MGIRRVWRSQRVKESKACSEACVFLVRLQREPDGPRRGAHFHSRPTTQAWRSFTTWSKAVETRTNRRPAAGSRDLFSLESGRASQRSGRRSPERARGGGEPWRAGHLRAEAARGGAAGGGRASPQRGSRFGVRRVLVQGGETNGARRREKALGPARERGPKTRARQAWWCGALTAGTCRGAGLWAAAVA